MARKRKSTGVPEKQGYTTNHAMARLAILGDSGVALFFSFSMLVMAMSLSIYMDHIDNSKRTETVVVDTEVAKFEALYQELGPVPEIDPPRVYSVGVDSFEDIRNAYDRDGVVAVRGLIPDKLLEQLDQESHELVTKEINRKNNKKRRQATQFHTMVHSAVFLEPPVVIKKNEATKNDTSTIQNMTAFFEVALLSDIPKFGAGLMLPELQAGENVRMIRDIFLTKDKQEVYCGFHVDDTGFWPTTAGSPGINAWIALDDMPAEGGGGFALAVGSHQAQWRHDAQYITGATTFFPKDGFQSAADMFANRTGSGTCNIQTSAPHLFRRMEETKRVYELLKGDVIFHHRWLFHRTVPFEREYVAKRKNDNLLYRRYSVRYAPGSAVIPPGYGTEPSVLWNTDNANRTADEVCLLDGPWYPRVWPSTSRKELEEMKGLIHTKLPIATERKIQKQKEMQPYLKEAAMKQSKESKKARA